MFYRLGIVLLLAAGMSVEAQQAIPVYLSGATPAGCALTYSAAPNVFTCTVPGGGGIPVGSILMITSGACPTGFTEVAALNGVTLVGTLAANGDVGTTGGSDTITPTTSAINLTAAAQTVSSLTAAAQNISGSTAAEALHTHTYTQVPNHVHVEQMNTAITGATGAGFPAVADPSTSGGPGALWVSTANPTGGVATGTTAAGSSHLHSVGTLAAAPSAVTGTMNPSSVTGSVLMNSFDNRPAYMKIIFCMKT